MQPERTGNPVLGTSAFLILGFAAPLSLVDWQVVGGGFNVLLSWTIVLIAAARLAAMLASGRPQLLAMSFYLFVYPFLGLAALAQVSSGRFPLDNLTYRPEIITRGLFLVLLGLLAYEAGRFIARTGYRADREVERPATVAFSQKRVLAVGLVGAVFILITLNNAGVGSFFSSRDEASVALAGDGARVQVYALQNKTGYLIRNILVHIPIFLALLALLVSQRNRTWIHTSAGAPLTWALIGVVALLNVLVNNPLSNSRFWFGTIVLSIAAIYIPWRTAHGFRVLVLSGLGVFLFLFTVLDAFRRAVRDFAWQSPAEGLTSDGSYSAFQTVLNGQRYLEGHDLTGGHQLLSALMAFVPRSVWPGKSVDTGALIDDRYNRAASLWTELEIDFGLLGVVVGFAALGAFTLRLEERMTQGTTAAVALLPVLAGLQIFLLRGSLFSAVGTAYPLLFFYLLMLRRRGRATSTRRRENPMASLGVSSGRGQRSKAE